MRTLCASPLPVQAMTTASAEMKRLRPSYRFSLGDELTAILKSIENDTYFGTQETVQLETGAHVLPHFTKDTTDRNRTSPFAFTGNKFEFRMLGSSTSVANPNMVLNAAVAEALHQFYLELSEADPEHMTEAVHAHDQACHQKT